MPHIGVVGSALVEVHVLFSQILLLMPRMWTESASLMAVRGNTFGLLRQRWMKLVMPQPSTELAPALIQNSNSLRQSLPMSVTTTTAKQAAGARLLTSTIFAILSGMVKAVEQTVRAVTTTTAGSARTWARQRPVGSNSVCALTK